MVLSAKRADFQDPTTRVRMNPETQITFDDTDQVIMRHPLGEKSMQIKYDILLIIYPMVHWVTVEELCQNWPPEDQAKIKEHLEMMYQIRLIVTDESEMPQKTESGMPPAQGQEVVINVENHHAMMKDSIRMACYRRAIEQAVNPESIVMDMGSGSGILSFFAARAGAKKVYGIERRPDMVMLARELAKENGFDRVIEFIQNSTHMVAPEQLTPRPNVLVSEILGNAILEESILEFTIDVRDRLLAPDAKMIPMGLEIMLIPFDSGESIDKRQEVSELEGIYGFNFNLLKEVLSEKPTLSLERFNPGSYDVLSEPVKVIDLDFYTITSPTFEVPYTYTPKKDGFVNGFCAYFRAKMDEETILTNSPYAPPTHWTQMVFHFPARRAVKATEAQKMIMRYDGGLTIWYEE